jgi:hypothetical protein
VRGGGDGFHQADVGAFDEKTFGSDHGNTLWIKFSDKHGVIEWIGKFGTGLSSFARVEKVFEPDKFLVSAGGFGYVVDATNRQLLTQCLDEKYQDIAYDWQNGRLIAADYHRLHFIEGGKKVWSSTKISVDGIRDLKMNGRLITGLGVFAYGGPEKEFTFYVDTRKVKRGWLWRIL